jgi:hypothetical protein
MRQINGGARGVEFCGERLTVSWDFFLTTCLSGAGLFSTVSMKKKKEIHYWAYER